LRCTNSPRLATELNGGFKVDGLLPRLEKACLETRFGRLFVTKCPCIKAAGVEDVAGVVTVEASPVARLLERNESEIEAVIELVMEAGSADGILFRVAMAFSKWVPALVAAGVRISKGINGGARRWENASTETTALDAAVVAVDKVRSIPLPRSVPNGLDIRPNDDLTLVARSRVPAVSTNVILAPYALLASGLRCTNSPRLATELNGGLMVDGLLPRLEKACLETRFGRLFVTKRP
jgi:hypothetical protein